MYYKEHKYSDEFWGAKCWTYEYEIFESYDGEVFEIIAEKIEKMEIDEIPEYLEVEVDEREFVINVYEFLSDEEYEKLEKMLDEIYAEEGWNVFI